MSENRVRIVSRKSLLALWQANFVKEQLLKHYPSLEVIIVGMNTLGDKILDQPLTALGGKGLFVKELEEALLHDEADIAVHSMKDVPASLPPGLEITAILKRADPREAFICNHTQDFFNLPPKACVGTSSIRRQAQLLKLRPDLIIKSLRGNVDTRLKKLDQGEFDALILAACGLKRLNLHTRIASLFETKDILPSIGQGALGIECRTQDTRLQRLLKPLNHRLTQACLTAERTMNHLLGGNCTAPVAGLAYIDKAQRLCLEGLVTEPQGKRMLLAKHSGKITAPEMIGKELAQVLMTMGADAIIKACAAQVGLTQKK